ncbi:S41 family peptidase [Bacillus carboniphilus]|uniref:S41 family peptidase n=1 Tax=Bacillus carboniphilus TaxID=86663 RepID=A0ABY9JR72_9BACI|nr:S41 family peptidase [Bacillus carboniphilus]WLR41832.1 S41 family peptidase [Bacillus carboniphilus]
MARMEEVLTWLGCEIKNDGVKIKVEKPNETILAEEVKFTSIEKVTKSENNQLVYYQILPEYQTAILTIAECRFDENYKQTLEQFFQEVAKWDVERIVVDLRKNTGGNSIVVNEFCRYLEHENAKMVALPNTQSIENLFSGDVFVATSNQTFAQLIYLLE